MHALRIYNLHDGQTINKRTFKDDVAYAADDTTILRTYYRRAICRHQHRRYTLLYSHIHYKIFMYVCKTMYNVICITHSYQCTHTFVFIYR